MKTSKKIVFYLLLLSFIFSASCRKEEIQAIQLPAEDTLENNSNIANLIKRTAANDGSNDNILDYANCLNIQLPVSVFANGIELLIANENDYYNVELIFDEDEDDIDTLEIVFPITILLFDYTEININNLSELNSYANTCNGENISDDDIECIDFQYPITASIFNVINELISSETFMNDNEFYNFIDDIDEDDIITLNFPITVVLSDNSQVIINSLSELEMTISDAQNDCDEDDDYDYNDDDCDTCTANQITDILTSCSDWTVDKLKRNDIDYNDFYDGYLFNFFTDGTVSAYWSGITVYGTWESNGSENNISIIIDIPALTLCNNTWRLHEIQSSPGETKVDLRVEDFDRLRYENTCN